MDFSQVAAEFHKLKAQYDAGALTEANFKARLQDLMIQDEQGRWWMIGYETGQWYVHDGEKWVRGEPPVPSMPPTATIAPPVTPPGERTEPEKTVSPSQAQSPQPWLRIGVAVVGVILVAIVIVQLAGQCQATPTPAPTLPVTSTLPTVTPRPPALPPASTVQLVITRVVVKEGTAQAVREVLASAEPAGPRDMVGIMPISPALRTILKSNQTITFRFRLSYSLVSRDDAFLTVSIAQFDDSASKCDMSSAELVASNSVRVKRGQGDVELEVEWLVGDRGKGRFSPTGYAAPAPRLGESYLGVFSEFCYFFTP